MGRLGRQVLRKRRSGPSTAFLHQPNVGAALTRQNHLGDQPQCPVRQAARPCFLSAGSKWEATTAPAPRSSAISRIAACSAACGTSSPSSPRRLPNGFFLRRLRIRVVDGWLWEEALLERRMPGCDAQDALDRLGHPRFDFSIVAMLQPRRGSAVIFSEVSGTGRDVQDRDEVAGRRVVGVSRQGRPRGGLRGLCRVGS